MVPNFAAHIRTLDDERLEAFVKDWISRRTRDYVETERWSGSGDKGRDVVGYATQFRHEGDWDNFQCKQLSARLPEQSAFVELGKIFMHAAEGAYSLPRSYIFVAPKGVVRTVKDYIAHPSRFRQAFLDKWEQVCARNLVENRHIPLTPEIGDAIRSSSLSSASIRSMRPGWLKTLTRNQRLSIGSATTLAPRREASPRKCPSVFFETFANPEIVIPPPDGPVLADSEAANRYFFLTSYFALISITTGICLYFWSDTRSILDRPSRLAVRLVGVVLICLLGYSVVARGGDSPKTYNFVGQALFAKALCTAPLPGKLGFLARRAQGIGDIFLDPTTLEAALCKGIATRGNSLASVFAPLQKIDDLFIVLAVPALILGCVSALALPSGEVPYDVEVHILSVQVRRVKAYLYLSALLLLVIVVLTISWMTFPTYLLAGEPAKRYDALVHSISAYYGLQYVLILCSYYIPVSLRLSRRVRGLAYRAILGAQAPNEQMLEDWEQKSGLLLHDLRSYKTVAALLAPLFPGIIGAVLAVAGK